MGLERLASLSAATTQYERAARLYGAAAAVRQEIGAFPQPIEGGEREEVMSRVRAALGDEAAAALWAAGKETSLQRAITEALSLPVTDVPTASIATPPTADAYSLTHRELDVLTLLTQRHTDLEIAAALFISPKTASNHVANILSKLGARNRREAAAIAVRHALL